MSGSVYNFPSNDSETLYIDADCFPYSFGQLLAHVQEYFHNKDGSPLTLDQLNIEIVNWQHTGCNCCPDLSDWTRYLKVTFREEVCQKTKAVPIRALCVK